MTRIEAAWKLPHVQAATAVEDTSTEAHFRSEHLVYKEAGIDGELAEALDSEPLRALKDIDPYEERERYVPILAEELEPRRFEEVVEAFDAHAIWYARVQDYEDLKRDPQAIHNQVFREVPVGNRTATLVNHPLRYDGEVPKLRHLASEVGEDGRDILADLGYSPGETEALIDDKVIFAPS